MFSSLQVCPGIYHITDAMGVSMTLIEGQEEAVLFDAGYGTEDVRAFAATAASSLSSARPRARATRRLRR